MLRPPLLSSSSPIRLLRVQLISRGCSSSALFPLLAPLRNIQKTSLQQCRRHFFSRSPKPPAPITNASIAKKNMQSMFKYPETLLIYHAGRRTIFVGVMKLATIYPVLVTLFFIYPALANISDFSSLPYVSQYPLLLAHPHITMATMVIASALPLSMFYLAAPYVTHIHVKLPNFARGSQDALMQYVRKMPESAVLKVFTMRSLGRPQFVDVPVGKLKWRSKRLGCVNWEWKKSGSDGKGLVTDFYVEERGGASVTEPKVFREIVGRVRQQTLDPKPVNKDK